jgi:hypothetical protein|nr:hypothetical protein [uncultured Acetatifactor sp.]
MTIEIILLAVPVIAGLAFMLNGILSDVSYVKLKCMIFAYHRRHPISMAWAAPA